MLVHQDEGEGGGGGGGGCGLGVGVGGVYFFSSTRVCLACKFLDV